MRICVRLLDEIDEPLRLKVRYQGEFAAKMIEAIEQVDLKSIPLVKIREPKVRNTTIRVSEALFLRLTEVAKVRETSVNALINSAVSSWLKL